MRQSNLETLTYSVGKVFEYLHNVTLGGCLYTEQYNREFYPAF